MAGKIPAHFIQDLLARTDIVDLVDARVPLKRSGSNFVARCPFHNEKTPSFSVNREKQFYYCFGCGARGTAISFLMEYDRMSFVEAVDVLADSAGLEVPRESGDVSRISSKGLNEIYDVQELACRFYQFQLKSHPNAGRVVDYLQARGLTGELALRYRVGYAPVGPRSLPDDFPKEALIEAGLLVSKEPGRSYDWFRDRVVFPIRDRRGRIVGFGGRVIGDGVPKYLNSPETDVFKKHREVYGLYELLAEERKPQFILVVEGYMDVIALAQYGINNAVATLGTATSVDHIGLLFRYTNEIVFCFDGDEAGRGAAWKALDSSLTHLKGVRQLRFLSLPDKHDPDSLVREEGAVKFRERTLRATPFSDYFFDRLSLNLDLSSIEGRAALVNKASPLIEKVPHGVFRDMIEERLQQLTGHPSLAIAQSGRSNPMGEKARVVGGVGATPSALRTFLALLLQNPNLGQYVGEETGRKLIEINKYGPLVLKIVEMLRENPQIEAGGLIEAFRGEPEEDWVHKLIVWPTQVAEDKVLEVFLNHLSYLTEDRLRHDRLEVLINKSKSSKLTESEQEELRRLTTLN